MTTDHGQPIDIWAKQHLSADDRAAVLALVGVRTVGDLRAVLERGGVKDEKLLKKLKQVLG